MAKAQADICSTQSAAARACPAAPVVAAQVPALISTRGRVRLRAVASCSAAEHATGAPPLVAGRARAPCGPRARATTRALVRVAARKNSARQGW
ncbi:hypothetical protein [Phaeacidiphilus oryzae]|uniref:hypothetical protein n=1 Tax=Phaeacidiphilus oryzae TaxID=348818 RepID=UPI00056C329F|nr:hypothetical protein [Phaeacidiphilus oryzae]